MPAPPDRPDVHGMFLPALLVSVTSFAAQCVIVASPMLRDILGLSEAALGWLLSMSLVTGMFGSLLGGWLADRGLGRLTAIASLALATLSYGLCALAPSYARYLVAAALIGVGNYAVSTVANVAVIRANAGGARRALTWLMLIAAGTGMAAPVAWATVLSLLSKTALGAPGAVQVAFLVSAIACGLTLPVVLAGKLHGGGPAPVPAAGSPVRIGGPALVMVCVFVGLHTSADNGMYVWLPDFASRRFDPSPFPIAWILSGYSGAYLVGRLVLTTLPERVDDLALLGAAAAVGAVLCVLAFRSGSQYALASLYVVAGLSLSVDYPSILAHIGRQFPHAAGRVVAIGGAVSGGASFLVPPLMGYLGDAAGTMVAGMMLPPILLATLSLSALLWRAYLRRRERVPSTAPVAA